MINDVAFLQAKQLAKLFLKKPSKLAAAESCTGGGLAEVLTRLPGSSAWFECAFVTYSNEAKQKMLGVSFDVLQKFGAVSEETANAMSRGAVENSRADYGVAITGVAGPDGGSEDKPVGTVCLSWYERGYGGTTIRVFFDGDRLKIREQSCLLAIQGLIDFLQKKSE